MACKNIFSLINNEQCQLKLSWDTYEIFKNKNGAPSLTLFWVCKQTGKWVLPKKVDEAHVGQWSHS